MVTDRFPSDRLDGAQVAAAPDGLRTPIRGRAMTCVGIMSSLHGNPLGIERLVNGEKTRDSVA